MALGPLPAAGAPRRPAIAKAAPEAARPAVPPVPPVPLAPLAPIGATRARAMAEAAPTADRLLLEELFRIQDEVPGLLDDSVRFDVDVFDVLAKQAKIVGELAAMGESPGRRPKLLSIVINPPDETPQVSGEEHRGLAERFRSWSRRMQLGGLQPAAARERIEGEIAARLRSGTLQGALVGLIKALPRERQAALFQMPPQEVPSILERELPEDLAAAGFQAERLGLSTTASRSDVLAALRRCAEEERELQELLPIAAAARRHPEKAANGRWTRAELYQALLRDRADSTARDGLKTSKREDALLDRGLKALMPKSRAQAAADLEPPIFIEEVPPRIGIFRGFAGNDCATSMSFPYPNSPCERVFFIRDADKRLKGYLAGTVVEVKGERAFYLHTISGGHISVGDTTRILGGFLRATNALDVARVVIPITARIHGNINFPDIRRAFEARGGEEVRLDYLDKPIRAVLDRYASAAFDRADVNTLGRALTRSPGDDWIRVRARAAHPKSLRQRPFDRTEALQFAADLAATGRASAAARILKLYDLAASTFDRLKELLGNPMGRGVDAFVAEVRGELETLGLPAPGDVVSRKPHLFAAGQLRAPDALAPEHHATTMNLVAEMLKNRADATPAYQLIQSNPCFFQENPKFIRLVEHLVSGTEEHLAALKQLLQAGISQELVRSIVRRSAETYATLGELDRLSLLRSQITLFGDLGPIDAADPQVKRDLVSLTGDSTVSKAVFEYIEAHRDDRALITELCAAPGLARQSEAVLAEQRFDVEVERSLISTLRGKNDAHAGAAYAVLRWRTRRWEGLFPETLAELEALRADAAAPEDARTLADGLIFRSDPARYAALEPAYVEQLSRSAMRDDVTDYLRKLPELTASHLAVLGRCAADPNRNTRGDALSILLARAPDNGELQAQIIGAYLEDQNAAPTRTFNFSWLRAIQGAKSYDPRAAQHLLRYLERKDRFGDTEVIWMLRNLPGLALCILPELEAHVATKVAPEARPRWDAVLDPVRALRSVDTPAAQQK